MLLFRPLSARTASGDGCYPLPCSMKCGLSSPIDNRSGRLAGPMLRGHPDTEMNLNLGRVSVRHVDHLDSMGVSLARRSRESDILRERSTWVAIRSKPNDTFPRKEVIQPQLPLRLPCYDFAPIASPTLDSCLRERLAYRLQVLPTFMA